MSEKFTLFSLFGNAVDKKYNLGEWKCKKNKCLEWPKKNYVSVNLMLLADQFQQL